MHLTGIKGNRSVWRSLGKFASFLTTVFALLHETCTAFATSNSAESLSPQLGQSSSRSSTLRYRFPFYDFPDRKYRSIRSRHNGRLGRNRNKSRFGISLPHSHVSIKVSFRKSPTARLSGSSTFNTSATMTSSSLSNSALNENSTMLRRSHRVRTLLTPSSGLTRSSFPRKWSLWRLGLATLFLLAGVGNGINGLHRIYKFPFPTIRKKIIEDLFYMLAFLGLGGFTAYTARPAAKPVKTGWNFKRALLGIFTFYVGIANWLHDQTWRPMYSQGWSGIAREQNTALIELFLWVVLSAYLVFSSSRKARAKKKW